MAKSSSVDMAAIEQMFKQLTTKIDENKNQLSSEIEKTNSKQSSKIKDTNNKIDGNNKSLEESNQKLLTNVNFYV